MFFFPNLQLCLSRRSLSLNLHSAASAFISSLGRTRSWLLSLWTPSSTLHCPPTIPAVLSSLCFHLLLLLHHPPPASLYLPLLSLLSLWMCLPLKLSPFMSLRPFAQSMTSFASFFIISSILSVFIRPPFYIYHFLSHFIFFCFVSTLSFSFLLSFPPAVTQWRVNKWEVMRAILSEPHPSHCHLIPTAVTVCTQVCVTAHMHLCVCTCWIENAEGYQNVNTALTAAQRDPFWNYLSLCAWHWAQHSDTTHGFYHQMLVECEQTECELKSYSSVRQGAVTQDDTWAWLVKENCPSSNVSKTLVKLVCYSIISPLSLHCWILFAAPFHSRISFISFYFPFSCSYIIIHSKQLQMSDSIWHRTKAN